MGSMKRALTDIVLANAPQYSGKVIVQPQRARQRVDAQTIMPERTLRKKRT
jgi:hypothetical protein